MHILKIRFKKNMQLLVFIPTYKVLDVVTPLLVRISWMNWKSTTFSCTHQRIEVIGHTAVPKWEETGEHRESQLKWAYLEQKPPESMCWEHLSGDFHKLLESECGPGWELQIPEHQNHLWVFTPGTIPGSYGGRTRKQPQFSVRERGKVTILKYATSILSSKAWSPVTKFLQSFISSKRKRANTQIQCPLTFLSYLF